LLCRPMKATLRSMGKVLIAVPVSCAALRTFEEQLSIEQMDMAVGVDHDRSERLFWASTNCLLGERPKDSATMREQNRVRSHAGVRHALAEAANQRAGLALKKVADQLQGDDAARFTTYGRSSGLNNAGVDAGNGGFIRGRALRGEIVCFYHGPLYHPLSGRLRLMARNSEYLLCRPDGYIVDGRPTDGTVSSLCGPLCNHPPAGMQPNVMFYAITLDARSLPADSASALKTISWYDQGVFTFDPKRYARTVVMVALRDIEDEELLVDYAYNPHVNSPAWYMKVPLENGERMEATPTVSLLGE
jgi:hypothetical protein